MHRLVGGVLAALLCVGFSVSAVAGGATSKKASVLVRDFTVGKKVKTDGGVLGGSFCVELAKDPRLDVVCQADVAQLLEFQAQRALQGFGAGGANPILRRMANVNYIVDGRVVQGKYGLILELTLAENTSKGDLESGPVAGTAVGRLKQKGIKGGISALIDRFPALAKRSAALFSPGATSPKGAPPPKPLKDK